MPTELSERIRRNVHNNMDGWIVRLMTEAADEIDRLSDVRDAAFNAVNDVPGVKSVWVEELRGALLRSKTAR